MTKFWRIFIAVVVVAIIALLATLFFMKDNTEQVNGDVKFTGKIEKIEWGIDYDGNNYMIIDGKHVIFDVPESSPEKGSLLGFTFSPSPDRKKEALKYYGRNVEVYAEMSDAFDSEGKLMKIYSLIGDYKYYIKLID